MSKYLLPNNSDNSEEDIKHAEWLREQKRLREEMDYEQLTKNFTTYLQQYVTDPVYQLLNQYTRSQPVKRQPRFVNKFLSHKAAFDNLTPLDNGHHWIRRQGTISFKEREGTLFEGITIPFVTSAVMEITSSLAQDQKPTHVRLYTINTPEQHAINGLSITATYALAIARDHIIIPRMRDLGKEDGLVTPISIPPRDSYDRIPASISIADLFSQPYHLSLENLTTMPGLSFYVSGSERSAEYTFNDLLIATQAALSLFPSYLYELPSQE